MLPAPLQNDTPKGAPKNGVHENYGKAFREGYDRPPGSFGKIWSSTISAGHAHMVAIRSDGIVAAIGLNHTGVCDVDY